MKGEVDLFGVDKYQSFLQVATIVFGGVCEACLKYPK